MTKAVVDSHVRTCPCSTDDLNKLRRDKLAAEPQKLYQNMVRCRHWPMSCLLCFCHYDHSAVLREVLKWLGSVVVLLKLKLKTHF